jgi:hypothetical protein
VLKSVYRAAGWDLLDDRYLQVMGLLCAMPMTMANGLSRDLERMKRMRTHAHHHGGQSRAAAGRISRRPCAAPAPDRPTGPALLLVTLRERGRQP